MNSRKKIVAIGHNDLPVGCVDAMQLADFKFDWKKRNVREDGWENTKYPYGKQNMQYLATLNTDCILHRFAVKMEK